MSDKPSQLALQVGDDLAAEIGAPRITAEDIRRGIERRYSDGWHVMHEVANCVGWTASARSAKLNRELGGDMASRRYLDSLAIGMYKSTGHEIHGLEIKVSRADWLSELRQPEKAGAFRSLVNRFFVVAPKDVVRVDELPDGWGSCVWYPSMMRVQRQATFAPNTISPTFMCALIARAMNPKRLAEKEE